LIENLWIQLLRFFIRFIFGVFVVWLYVILAPIILEKAFFRRKERLNFYFWARV